MHLPGFPLVFSVSLALIPLASQLIQFLSPFWLPQWMIYGPMHLTVGHMIRAGVEGTPGPITPQLVTLISEEASCRVTEQGLGRERMDKEKRRR